MADISSITSIYSGIKTALGIAKFLNNSDFSLEKAEMKLKIAELIEALADTKIQIQNVITEKDEKIKELTKALEIKGKLRYEPPYYWLDEANSKEGPYCQLCYDKERKLIRLQGVSTGRWECHACKNYYNDKNFKEKPSAGIGLER